MIGLNNLLENKYIFCAKRAKPKKKKKLQSLTNNPRHANPKDNCFSDIQYFLKTQVKD